MPSRMHAFFIESPARRPETGWLSSHPSVDARIAALIRFAGGREPTPTPTPTRPT
jgi:heat shock protein HtpX